MRDTIWSFKTAHFKVALEITDCHDSWDGDDADVQEQIDRGEIAWFDATVAVYLDGNLIGRDDLGCCAYKTVGEFYTSHRDSDPMNRNCSIMRNARGGNVVICHYFPSMVSQAITDARANLARLREVACKIKG